MSIGERVDTAAAEITAHGDANTDKIIETVQRGFEKLSPKNINTWDDTVPCAKRLKISDESNPICNLDKNTHASSSEYSGLACLLDVNPNNISDTSDEEEDQINAPSKHAEVETQKKTQPCGVHPSPKTDAGKRSENKEDAARIADGKWKIHREERRNV